MHTLTMRMGTISISTVIGLVGCSTDRSTRPNPGPNASFTYSTPTYVNEYVYFDASGSSDPRGYGIAMGWAFGDGQIDSGMYCSHKFRNLGTAEVTLFVVNEVGEISRGRQRLDIGLGCTENDCEAFEGHYALSDRHWPPAFPNDMEIPLILCSNFMDLDPGWVNVADNTARAAMDSWNYSSGARILFSCYPDVRDLGQGRDGNNVVCAGDCDGDLGILARAHCWYYVSNNEMFEVDIEVNRGYVWGVNGEIDRFDLESTLAHELGHAWCLSDLYEPDEDCETMYGIQDEGEMLARTLYCGDKNGVKTRYGVRSAEAALAEPGGNSNLNLDKAALIPVP